jgi:hypothetical protein
MGLNQSFNSKGPIMLTLFGSAVLAVNLTGLRIGNGSQKKSLALYKKNWNPVSTRQGWFTFVHSHHTAKQRMEGHEFKFRNKYFCTGCYGTLIGTIIAIMVFTAYLLFGMPDNFVFLATIVAPISFIPIILRYTVFTNMKTSMRLLSNSLLPVGCSLYLVVMDHVFQSWVLNACLVLLILMTGFIRAKVANNGKKEGNEGVK